MPHDWSTGVLAELEVWSRLGNFSPRIFHSVQEATETHASFTIHTRTGLRGVMGVLVPLEQVDRFKQHFRPFFDSRGILCIDSLIHLCMIVKDAGEAVTDTLAANLPWIDRWTVLDIGSTDGTPERIAAFMDNHGLLPFGSIHRRLALHDAAACRNACLDLARRSFPCTTYLVIDDTHILRAEPYAFKQFLISALHQHKPWSISLVARTHTHDLEHSMAAIIPHDSPAAYIHPVHECLDTHEHNLTFPTSLAHLENTEPPHRRTRRLDHELSILSALVDQEGSRLETTTATGLRHRFYLAQTLNELGRNGEAAEHYAVTAQATGGDVRERVESYIQLAAWREACGMDWQGEIAPLYRAAHELDTRLPEAVYHMAMHHYRNSRHWLALKLMHVAFQIVLPKPFSLWIRPGINYVDIPFVLITLCLPAWEEEAAAASAAGEQYEQYERGGQDEPLLDPEYRIKIAHKAMRLYKHIAPKHNPMRGKMRTLEEILSRVKELKDGCDSLPRHLPRERPRNQDGHQRWAVVAVGSEPLKSRTEAVGAAVSKVEAHCGANPSEIWYFTTGCKETGHNDSDSGRAPTTHIPFSALWPTLALYHFDTVIVTGNSSTESTLNFLSAMYRTNCSNVILAPQHDIDQDSVLVVGRKLKAIIADDPARFRLVFGDSDEINALLRLTL